MNLQDRINYLGVRQVLLAWGRERIPAVPDPLSEDQESLLELVRATAERAFHGGEPEEYTTDLVLCNGELWLLQWSGEEAGPTTRLEFHRPCRASQYPSPEDELPGGRFIDLDHLDPHELRFVLRPGEYLHLQLLNDNGEPLTALTVRPTVASAPGPADWKYVDLRVDRALPSGLWRHGPL